MKARRVFVIILIVYLLGFFAHAIYLGKTVYGDGVYYYQWLLAPLTPNKFAIGPALLWLPTYSIFHNQFAVGVASVLFAIIGLLLLYRLLLQFFTETTSLLTVLALAFATNLFFYGSLDTVNSHALSFFAATLYLSFLFAKKKNVFAIGFSLGIMGIIRPQDLIFGILSLPFLFQPRFISGLLLAMIPLFYAWQLTTGRFWLSGYFANGEGFNFLRPHVFEVLFSAQNGLFLYAPILLIGLVGLFFWKNRLRLFFYLTMLLELLIVSSWSTWWQGASYGGRMFVSSLPIFAIGIAQIFQKLMQRGWNEKLFFLILIGPLSGINMVMIFFFLLTH